MTSILRFVKGLDLSGLNLEDGLAAESTENMPNLLWLRLNRTGLSGKLPENLGTLINLEKLSATRNEIEEIPQQIFDLRNLTLVNLNANKLKTVPEELFDLEDLQSLDISNNEIQEIPEAIADAKALRAFQCHNNKLTELNGKIISGIRNVLVLDVSYNRITKLPAEMGYMKTLQFLSLSHNTIENCKDLLWLKVYTDMRVLRLAGISKGGEDQGLFDEIMNDVIVKMKLLRELDLSGNAMETYPKNVNKLKELRHLDLSDNCLRKFPCKSSVWKELVYLDISGNKLQTLPEAVWKLTSLRRLSISSNPLGGTAISRGVSSLINLQVLYASSMELQSLPIEIEYLDHIRDIYIQDNMMKTIPPHVYYKPGLTIHTEGNPGFYKPAKQSLERKNLDPIESIDFVKAEAQSKKRGAKPDPKEDIPVDARAKFNRPPGIARAGSEGTLDFAAHSDNTRVKVARQDQDQCVPAPPPMPGKPQVKPEVQTEDLFDVDAESLGLYVWRIEDFSPVEIDDDQHGVFAKGDCYIVLQIFPPEREGARADHTIYFWIGSESSLDKQASAAIHSVSLRNYLKASCSPKRVEEGDEDDHFLVMFDFKLKVVEGGTESGLYSIDDDDIPATLYLYIGGIFNWVERVQTDSKSLHSDGVFLLDAGKHIFVWQGKDAGYVRAQKARLLADKINKDERKGVAEIEIIHQRDEPSLFWNKFPGGKAKYGNAAEAVKIQPKVYEIVVSPGRIDFYNTINVAPEGISKEILETEKVIVIDCVTDIYVWIGKRAKRIHRAAAGKVSKDLLEIGKRPSWAMVHRIIENSEPAIFKTKFNDWKEVIKVDHTFTRSDAVKHGYASGALDSNVSKVDIGSLLMNRALLPENAVHVMIEAIAEDMDSLRPFVLNGKSFAALPEEEVGHFYSRDCYAFLYVYWAASPHEERENEGEVVERKHCKLYFWEGRDAPRMGWLTFTFSFQGEIEKSARATYETDVKIIRVHQQRETCPFMSIFRKRLIIHDGSRNNMEQHSTKTRLYRYTSKESTLFYRAVQIPLKTNGFNTNDAYIIVQPDGCWLWVGEKFDDAMIEDAEEVAASLSQHEEGAFLLVRQGEENEEFLEDLREISGKFKTISTTTHRISRLFRCSADTGDYVINELHPDFSQDDLVDDDAMILDSGSTDLFVWLGGEVADIERRLAIRAAKEYKARNKDKRPDGITMSVVHKGFEPEAFTDCFVSWGEFVTKK
eukprot:Clim_evm114s172 gene=Clim_evmTU114s172